MRKRYLPKEKLLILAITYPEFSKKKQYYTVCVAGINQNGELRRIYPIPFHLLLRLKYFFKKFQWIEYELKEKGDTRKESYKIYYNTLKTLRPAISTEVFSQIQDRLTTLEELNELKKDFNISLGFVKPRIEDLDIFLSKERIFRKKTLDSQKTLFNESLGDIYVAPLVKFNFCCCSSSKCNGHNIICEDIYFWNIFKLFLGKEYRSPMIKQKIQNHMNEEVGNQNDILFMVGTHYLYKTWMIISIISKVMFDNFR